MRILAVDDQLLNRRLLAAQLESDGHVVCTAADGREALEVLGQEAVDLVISDILMPRMDGFALCRALRADARFDRLPFIFYTSTYNSPGDRATALLVGGDAYLVKPVPLEELRRAIAECLRSERIRRDRPAPDELVVMREYNVALVRKLEEKNAELQEKIATLEAVERQLTLQATALHGAASAIMITDDQAKIVWVNPAFTAITGYEAEEVVGQTPRFLRSGAHPRPFYENLWQTVLAGGSWQGEFINRRKDGSLFHGEQTITPVRGPSGKIDHFVGMMNDVTAQRRAEEERRLAESRYRHIFENSIEGLFQTTPDGRLLAANPALARMAGYGSPAELIEECGHFVSDRYVRAEDRRQFTALMARDGAVAEFETELRRRDGTTAWVSLNARALRDTAGVLVCFEGSVRDISAQRHAAESLRVSEARFRMLAGAIGEVFWLSDLARTAFHYVSPAFEKVWGRPCREVIVAPELWLAAVHADDRARVSAAAARLETGDYDEVYRILDAAGNERWVRDRAFPVRDDAGRATHIAGLVEEITGRMAAERRIAAQAHLLDLASDSITERTLDGGIVYWNQGSERLYGWSAAEALNRSVEALIQPPADDYRRARDAVLETGHWAGELTLKHRDGRTRVVLSRWTLLRTDQAAPYAVLVIESDITEKKALEAQFLRAQRLEAIGTLASGIAHDLNNLLAPIMMAAPMLRWELAPAEAEKLLLGIESSAQRGADLVRQLLAFSRGFSGERMLLQTGPILREVARVAEQTFPKSIEIECRVAAKLWPVRGDPTQLHQVLLNLAVNARDAMPHGGRLTLAADNTTVDAATAATTPGGQAGKFVRLRVVDTGTGIAPEIVERIFDPFFTTKETGKGTGLGLSTVAGIARGHNGFVQVQSAPGEGAIFSVHIPAEPDAEVVAAPPAPRTLPRGHGELVLVVDDEENIRRVVQETLSRHGYTVVLAANGADAAAQYAQLGAKIAAVVTDIDMPVMDGVAMIHVLKRINPHVRVLVSSGLASSAKTGSRSAELRSLGVNRMLGKPYAVDELLGAVRGLIDGV